MEGDEREQERILMQGVEDGLAVQGPAEDPLPPIDVGVEPTAYPLLGFDAELPKRTYESVKQSLDSFEAVTKKPGARGKKLFPPIRQSKTAWPQVDDHEDHVVGASATIEDAQPDLTLPPVVPAPIAMPVIIDD
eukprot:2786495-Rhodomonas_salina.1